MKLSNFLLKIDLLKIQIRELAERLMLSNFQQKMLKIDLLKTLKRELSVTFVLELLKIRLSDS